MINHLYITFFRSITFQCQITIESLIVMQIMFALGRHFYANNHFCICSPPQKNMSLLAADRWFRNNFPEVTLHTLNFPLNLRERTHA